MKLKIILALFLGAATALAAASITAHDAYVRATPPNMPNSAAFMTLKNHSDAPLAVTSASSDAAKKVELHTHEMKNGAMRMFQVPQIDVAAQGQTLLQPGGFHVMLLGLHKPLAEGQTVSVTLTLSNGETVTVDAPVKKVMAGMQMHQGKCGQGKCGQGKCGQR